MGKTVWHVTHRDNEAAILKDGFEGGWGDDGFGVYVFTDALAALRYADKGGWDEKIEAGCACVFEIEAEHAELCEIAVHPEWPNPEFYQDVLYHPMQDDGKEIWAPARRVVAQDIGHEP